MRVKSVSVVMYLGLIGLLILGLHLHSIQGAAEPSSGPVSYSFQLKTFQSQTIYSDINKHQKSMHKV